MTVSVGGVGDDRCCVRMGQSTRGAMRGIESADLSW